MRALLVMAALGAALFVPALAQDATGDRARGRQLYVTIGCYQCHGYEGQGSPASGPRIAPDPMPYESLKLLLRQPLNVMPAYAESALPDSAIADLHAYLAAIPKPRPVKDIPLLNP